MMLTWVWAKNIRPPLGKRLSFSRRLRPTPPPKPVFKVRLHSQYVLPCPAGAEGSAGLHPVSQILVDLKCSVGSGVAYT